MNATRLTPGTRVRIKRAFRDLDGRQPSVGDVLTFVACDYFPHDGGYTLRFEGGALLRFIESDPSAAEVLFDVTDTYWEPLDG